MEALMWGFLYFRAQRAGGPGLAQSETRGLHCPITWIVRSPSQPEASVSSTLSAFLLGLNRWCVRVRKFRDATRFPHSSVGLSRVSKTTRPGAPCTWRRLGKRNNYSSVSGSRAMLFSPAAFFSQYLRTQASQLLPAAVSRPVKARAAISE